MGLLAHIFQRRKSGALDITRQECIRGHRIMERGGWVRGEGYATREKMEKSLKRKAAKLGGNAVIKFYWNSYPKGRKDLFKGEGEAVHVEKKSIHKAENPARKST